MPEFSWQAANEATSEDVEAVFDTPGARKCRCQALKVPGWIWRDTTQEERDAALVKQAGWADGMCASLRSGCPSVAIIEDDPRSAFGCRRCRLGSTDVGETH